MPGSSSVFRVVCFLFGLSHACRLHKNRVEVLLQSLEPHRSVLSFGDKCDSVIPDHYSGSRSLSSLVLACFGADVGCRQWLLVGWRDDEAHWPGHLAAWLSLVSGRGQARAAEQPPARGMTSLGTGKSLTISPPSQVPGSSSQCNRDGTLHTPDHSSVQYHSRRLRTH